MYADFQKRIVFKSFNIQKCRQPFKKQKLNGFPI